MNVIFDKELFDNGNCDSRCRVGFGRVTGGDFLVGIGRTMPLAVSIREHVNGGGGGGWVGCDHIIHNFEQSERILELLTVKPGTRERKNVCQ